MTAPATSPSEMKVIAPGLAHLAHEVLVPRAVEDADGDVLDAPPLALATACTLCATGR
jgi:hypothetical protein